MENLSQEEAVLGNTNRERILGAKFPGLPDFYMSHNRYSRGIAGSSEPDYGMYIHTSDR
jgi:hypothetical protein